MFPLWKWRCKIISKSSKVWNFHSFCNIFYDSFCPAIIRTVNYFCIKSRRSTSQRHSALISFDSEKFQVYFCCCCFLPQHLWAALIQLWTALKTKIFRAKSQRWMSAVSALIFSGISTFNSGIFVSVLWVKVLSFFLFRKQIHQLRQKLPNSCNQKKIRL